MNVNVIVYLNDIIIYSKNIIMHKADVRWILKRLRQHKLYIVLNKCIWFIDIINFLSFIILSKKMQMQFEKIKVIYSWFILRNIIDIMQFLKLINFYRRFIKNFNKIIMLLIEMLKKSQKLKKKTNKWKRSKSWNKNQS